MNSLIEQAKWLVHCRVSLNDPLRKWVSGYGKPSISIRLRFAGYLCLSVRDKLSVKTRSVRLNLRRAIGDVAFKIRTARK